MRAPGWRHIATALAATATLAGCANVAGSPTAGEIDVRTLDVGSYSTLPLDLRYEYMNTLRTGKELAVMRLAENVALGSEIDPKMVYGRGSTPILTGYDATQTLADVNEPVVERDGMMFGFSMSAGATTGANAIDPSRLFAAITVMQFPDASSAQRAAVDIDATDFAVAADRNQHLSLPTFPQAQAHWRPGIATIGSTLAHGQYVVNLYLGISDADAAKLTAFAEKVYRIQLPLLDALAPLTPEAILRLDNDPDDMLRRTLNPDAVGYPDAKDQATTGRRGFLHRFTNQQGWQAAWDEHGIDRFAVSGSTRPSWLFRTRDDSAATAMTNAVLATSFPVDAAAPRGVPVAHCRERDPSDTDTPRFACLVGYRRYTAVVQSDQLADAQQRAAAQYAILANSQ